MSNSVCLDASFVVRLLESTSPDAPAVRLWRQWSAEGRPLVAPALLFFEVTNALHRYVRHGLARPQTARALLDQALRLGIRLYTDADLHLEALTLARELRLPAAYDAHYLALARRLGAECWTADRRLAQTVAGRFPWVHALT